MFFMFLIIETMAADVFYERTGLTDDTGQPNTGRLGWVIEMYDNSSVYDYCNITKVIVFAEATPIICELMDNDLLNLQAGSFTGNNCTLNYKLDWNTKYYPNVHNVGNSYTDRYEGNSFFPNRFSVFNAITQANYDWDNETPPGNTSIYVQTFDGIEMSCYSSGPPPPIPPAITINTNLIDYTNSTDNPFFFTVNVTAANVTNITTWTVKVYLNDTLNQTIFTSLNLNASSLTLNLTYGTDQLGYNINITINNTNSGVPVSDNIQRLDIFLDSVIPVAVQSNMINNSVLYYGIDTLKTIILNGSDNNLYAMNLSLKNSSGYVLNNTFVENINTTTYNINFSFNTDALLNGSYEIWGHVWDNHNPVEQPHEQYKSFTKDGDTYNISFQYGDLLISDPNINELELEDEDNKYKEKFKFNDYSGTMVLSSNSPLRLVTDTEHKGHFVSLGLNKYRDLDSPYFHIDSVTKISDYSYSISYHVDLLELETSSIGDLNTLLSIWKFSISHGFTFTAIDSIANTSISNFTIEIWNGTTLLDNKTTTTNNLTFNLTSGSYHTNITNENYVRNESNITYSHGGTHTFYLTASNSLYLFFYDEEDKSLVNTINVSIDVLGPSSATNYLTDTGNKFISGFSTGNYEIRYSGPGYRTRTYYTTVATSTTQRIDLYMIKNSTSSLIVFFIGDEKSNPIFNATLKAKRFMLTDNAYILVSMERTDLNGETAMYLEPNDVFYSFIGEKDGAVIFTGTPQRIYSSNVYIRAPLQESEILGLSNIMLTTTTSLTYDNDTKLLSYTFNDATALVLEGCLKVIKRTSLTETTIGPTCVSSNSATIVINLTSHLQNDTSYTAIGTVKTNTTNTVFPTDVLMDFIHVNTPWDRFGKAGLFVAYILILTMFFVGITVNFSIAMSYSILAMAVVQIIGLSFFGWSLIIMFTIIGFIVAVVNRI